MSGGASFGSYEGGAFQQLINLLPSAETQYNVVVGISAGSLNSLCLAMNPVGQEVAASALMYKIYYDLQGS